MHDQDAQRAAHESQLVSAAPCASAERTSSGCLERLPGPGALPYPSQPHLARQGSHEQVDRNRIRRRARRRAQRRGRGSRGGQFGRDACQQRAQAARGRARIAGGAALLLHDQAAMVTTQHMQ